MRGLSPSRMAKARLGNFKNIFALIFGSTLLITGTIMYFSFEAILHSIFLKELVLRPDSDTFKIWRDTPIPMHMNFYMYNWTNPENLTIEKPILNQLGPYRFNMKEEKTNITWNANGTLTYRIARKWFFDAERSEGSLNDTVTTLNVIAMTAAHTVRDWSLILKKPLSISLTSTGQKVHVTKQVGDLLFNGYSDSLLDFARTLPNFAGVDIPYDKFGWFYLRNSSSNFEGVFNMDTGERGIADFGKVWRWNYDVETGFYEGACGKVYGSAGELFPPGQTKQKPIHMFSADLCRTIRLDFTEENEIQGVKGWKYTGGLWNMDNGTLDPNNECFCSGACSPAGVVNVTTCRYGAPGFVSYPHFLLADPFYLQQVHGLQPNPDKHTLYITLEPKTGIPLDVAARFQINILLSSVDSIGIYKNVPRIYFPMMWFEQRAYISDELSANLRLLLDAPFIGKTTFIITAAVGFLAVIITSCLVCDPAKRKRKLQNEDILLSENSMKPFIQPTNNSKHVNSEKSMEMKLLQNGAADAHTEKK